MRFWLISIVATIRQLARVVEEGKEEGEIPAHVDPDQVAWLITGWTLGGGLCDLMGLSDFLEPRVSAYWLDLMFGDLAREVGAASTA